MTLKEAIERAHEAEKAFDDAGSRGDWGGDAYVSLGKADADLRLALRRAIGLSDA